MPFLVYRSASTNEKGLTCLFPFSYPTHETHLNKISEIAYSEDIRRIKFLYVDLKDNVPYESSSTEFIESIFVEDKWAAPQLIIPSTQILDDYLQSRCTRLKRTLKRARNYISNYAIAFQEIQTGSPVEEIMNTWVEILHMDEESWKGQQESDMRSLEREDLQYLPFLMDSSSNCSLVVAKCHGKTPIAWSLMIRTNPGGAWYSVKWGASDCGRKTVAGISCLFEHISILYSRHIGSLSQHDFAVDFWGRRSGIYDQFANHKSKRAHITVLLREG